MKIGENKNTAFKRLAINRTNAILKNLRLLGNLSNKQNYHYTETDFKLIFNTIEKELKLTKTRFSMPLNKDSKFKL